MVDKPGKMTVNSENWKKAEQVVIEEMMRWAVNIFMPHRAPGPDGPSQRNRNSIYLFS